MTMYSHTRILFRCAMLDLLDFESGGGTAWGRVASDVAGLLAGQVPPGDLARNPRSATMGPDCLRDRAIVRLARTCKDAFTSPYPVGPDRMRRVLGDHLNASSLVATPAAYDPAWLKPRANGMATTRRMDSDDAERRAGLERALQAQRTKLAQDSADRWRHVHEDVTKVYVEDRVSEPTVVVDERPTRPYAAVRPPK